MSSIYGALITGCVGFFGAIIAIVSIKMQRKTSREKNALEFDVFYQTDSEVRTHWATVANYLIENKIKNDLSKIDKKSDVFVSIIFILNTWERASNAIRYNIFDEDYLYNVLGSSAIRIYDELKIFIESRQKKNELALANFEWLVIRWRFRKKLNGKNEINARNVLRISRDFTPILKRDSLHSYEKAKLLGADKYTLKIKHPFSVKKYLLKKPETMVLDRETKKEDD